MPVDEGLGDTNEDFSQNRTRKRRIENRAESSYPRKRASQACFVCRARKSRCDNERPKCGFCRESGNECGYPGTELAKIDTASLLILDHIARSESRLSAQIASLQGGTPATMSENSLVEAPASVLSPRSKECSHFSHPRYGHSGINGDSIMTWPVILDVLQALPEVGKWRAEPSNNRLDCKPRHEPSPSIMLEIKSTTSADLSSYDRERQHQTGATSICHPDSLDPEREPILIESYFAQVHSKSPIFDSDWFNSVRIQVLQQGWQPCHYVGPSSSCGLCPTRICIYLLVLALGHVTVSEENLIPGKPLTPSRYFDFALSWMGPTLYHQTGLLCPREINGGDGEDMREWIEKIQCLLLAGTHFMWYMRPWDAQKVFSEAAMLAKTIMHLEHWSDTPGSHITDLRFRVCCATAKAESEIQEEIMGFGPSGMSILSFADLENLPKPPPDAALNGQGNDSVKSQTWFYYLAEVASWKLLDRISKALYQDIPLSPSLADFVGLYPIARELEVQIQEWASSLPMHIFTNLSMFPNDILNTELSHHLANRHFHARITTFRPFLQAIVLHSPATVGSKDAYAMVSNGALKCVFACIEFIEAQASPRRHFGSWRCGRGIWAAGLSVLAAVLVPDLKSTMECLDPFSGLKDPVGGEMAAGPLLGRAEEALGMAAGWLSAWEEESPSLRLAAITLWTGLKEARKRGLFNHNIKS